MGEQILKLQRKSAKQYYKKISCAFRIADGNFPVLYTINSYGKIASIMYRLGTDPTSEER